MDKKYLIWIIGAVVVLGVAYLVFMGADRTATVALAELNASGTSGTASLTEENGNVIVTLNVTGGTAGVDMPAHIHDGDCPGVGAVRYPLQSVSNGTSTTTLTGVTLETLRSQLPLAINVHKSAAEVAVYVACGPVSL